MDGCALENYVSHQFIDELKCQGAILSAKDPGWIIVEMANVNEEDGIEKCQCVKMKLGLGLE